MTEDAQRPRRNRKRIWLALAALAVVLAGLIVPPWVSIGRYKSRITQLVSASLGRPVRLSSVQLRLLPRPGFVISDLVVEEDPAFGTEPLLHATTVTADIRLLSLWRGRLEISTISVDEASLNLVRSKEGRWNLDPLFRNAAAHSQGAAQQGKPLELPYLEATNSRVNIKNGLEKLPFSLVDADLSFWEERPGEWRVRLRGQPARTDVSLDLADTGIVDLEASMRRAPELRLMPVHLDMEWSEAQLGQLSRLIVGSDQGWRGDLTGEMHLDGTAESSTIEARLRATGVHRAEFAPAEPLDFDANCGFVYHYSSRSVENLACDSPLGDGHIRVDGTIPEGVPTRLSVELQRIPVQAGLDLLRTLRSGIGDGLAADGTVSGKLTFDRTAVVEKAAPPGPTRHPRPQPAKAATPAPMPLGGSFTVAGFKLSGAGLSQPIQIAKMSIDPAPIPLGQPQALTASVDISAGAPTPLAVAVRFAFSGYLVTLRGPAALPRLQEFAQVAGIADTRALGALAGDPATLELSAQGPWVTIPNAASSGIEPPGPEPVTAASTAVEDVAADQLTGTLTLHNTNWKSDSLASHVEISQATLHLGGSAVDWDPVAFSYGPLKGTASLQVPLSCEQKTPCPPSVTVHFADLDIGKLQSALLGAPKAGTLLSTLLARLSPSSPPAWPRVDGSLTADTLILGPVTMRDASATFRILPTGAEIASFDAGLLGGRVHSMGTLDNGEKPSYSLDASFSKVSGPALCQLLALRCRGGELQGSGKIQLSGYTGKDLASSAKGSLHFEWLHGAVIRNPKAPSPPALARFDRWSADAVIANGELSLQPNQVQHGTRKATVEGTVTFGDPAKVAFPAPNRAQTAKR